MQNRGKTKTGCQKWRLVLFIFYSVLLFMILSTTASAQQYRGLPVELYQPLILAATGLLGMMLWKGRKDPVIGIVCAIFWSFLAFAVNKITIYTADSQKITYMDAWLLTYLFGGVAIFCIIYTIYYTFLFTKDVAGYYESPKYEDRG